MNHYIFTVDINDSSSDQKVPVSKFFVEIPKLISIYDQEIESYYKYAFGKLPDDAPRHIQHNAILEIKEILLTALRNNVDYEFSDSNYVGSFSARIILNQEYSKVHCIKCGEDFDKNTVLMKKWSSGSGLAASGGTSMCCPNGHFLNSILEWDS